MRAVSAVFPIADAHQHFWDPRENYHPWLCDEPPIAFRYGDYSALRRPYLPADYLADAGHLMELSPALQKLIIPAVTLEDVHEIFRTTEGPSLTDIILEQRGPKD